MTFPASASDRYDEARAALASYEALALNTVSTEMELRLANALAALIDPATVGPRTPEDIEEAYNTARGNCPITEDYSIRTAHLAGLHGVYQLGIQAGWEDWEPENAPGMVDTRATYTLASLDGTDDAADWLQIGYTLDRSDVEWLRELEIVR